MALFMVVTDLLFMTSGNAGSHIAHLGGALAGWWFASGLSRGHDATSWINRCFDCFSEGLSFRRQSKKPKMKVHYGDKAKDYDYNARKKQQSEEIDRISVSYTHLSALLEWVGSARMTIWPWKS